MAVTRRCGICCPSLDNPVTDHPIQASVGLGGANRQADVLAVQQMLNALSPMEGGPDVSLAEDSLIGPKTRAAITKYQNFALGWADSRIDVNGPTIKALTGYIVDSPTIPYGKLGAPDTPAAANGTPAAAPKSPEMIAVEGAISIAEARRGIRMLEPRLNILRMRLARVTAGSPMMQLLNKHFATGAQMVTPQDVAHVQNVLEGIHVYIARFNAFGKLPVNNVILFDPNAPKEWLAYTVRGGDKMSTKQVQIYNRKGKLSKNPGQSIWLSPTFATRTFTEKQQTVLHEFCHFVGGRDGSFGQINDYAYVTETTLLTLPKHTKLHNAESLSLFFTEWCVGTDALLAMPQMFLVKDYYAEFPRVNGEGEVVTG